MTAMEHSVRPRSCTLLHDSGHAAAGRPGRVASCEALTWTFSVGAGDRDRTGMASLEGWGSAIELHPRGRPVDSRSAPGRSVVASAPALGAGDREFESPRPDQ
jgi:hypothetical protein